MCGPSNQSQEANSIESVSIPENKAVNASPTEEIDPENLDVVLLVRLIEEGLNNFRSEEGIPVLERDETLMKAAKEKNDYQTIIGIPNEHQSETSIRSVVDQINFYGGSFNLVGQNSQFYPFMIQRFEGQFTLLPPNYQKAAEDIVVKWKSSATHRENILNDSFTKVGTSVNWSDETNALFATQVFGGM